ncbi:MAG: tyrosine-type recombinase/integrase [Cyanothece sp. SIO1E1]|nr:tyrosine-type recombinase/integrase [Cyanothece sp. SIO1E1]
MPTIKSRTVGSSSTDPHAAKCPRDYLTSHEVNKLMAVAKQRGRHGHRDTTMILMAYRHGLRVSELCALRWDQVDFKAGVLYVRRLKRGIPSVHPLRGPELRALRQLRRESQPSPYLFVTERGAPMTAAGFRKLLSRISQLCSWPFSVHPHMLRHACGYKLVNDGHDTRAIQHYLGHRNIQNTVRYTQLSASCFAEFWQD